MRMGLGDAEYLIVLLKVVETLYSMLGDYLDDCTEDLVLVGIASLRR